MPFVTSPWPFFFFVEHGAMNSTRSVIMKIRTSRKLDAECYCAVITFLLAFGAKVLYPLWPLGCGVGYSIALDYFCGP